MYEYHRDGVILSMLLYDWLFPQFITLELGLLPGSVRVDVSPFFWLHQLEIFSILSNTLLMAIFTS